MQDKMRRELRYLTNAVAIDEFEKILKDGFRPGELTPAESVFLFEKEKEMSLDLSDSPEPGQDKDRAGSILRILSEYALPVSEDTVNEIRDALRLSEEITGLSDGTCAYLIRNGIEPTLDNIHKLRFVEEEQRELFSSEEEGEEDRKDGEALPLAWAFPEAEECKIEELLAEAGLEITEENRNLVQWLTGQNLYISPHTVRMLRNLRDVPVPFEEELLVRRSAKAIRAGISPKEMSVIGEIEGFMEMEGFADILRKAGDEKKNDFGGAEQEDLTGNPSTDEEDFEAYARKELHRLEDVCRQQFLKKGSFEEYAKEQYEEFLENILLWEEKEGRICEALDLRPSADTLGSLHLLMQEDLNYYNPLGKLLGRGTVARAFRQKGEERFETKEACEELFRALVRKVPDEYLKEGILLAKLLLTVRELSGKGFHEVPVAFKKEFLRIRIREDARFRIREDGKAGYTALLSHPEIGGMMVKYKETDSDTEVIVVMEKEESLEEFRNLELLEKRFRRAGKENVRIVYLLREEFHYADDFYNIRG